MNLDGNHQSNVILRVDLSNESISTENISPSVLRKFIGGTGLSASILWHEIPPEVKPLDPENVIAFAAGPLCGTMAPGSGRLDVAALSPLNDGLGTCNGGGFFAAHLRWAGYSAIVVTGKARRPVYLWVEDDEVRIKDAEYLWGKDTWETSDIIKKTHSDSNPDQVRVLSIGPAGEKMVLFASITLDYYHSASRTGLGAVMGSKNLKAIAVRGTRGVAPVRGQDFEHAVSEFMHSLPPFGSFGHGMGYRRDTALAAGDIAGKHFQEGVVSHWNNVLAPVEAALFRSKNLLACHCCPQCCNTLEVKEGKYKGLKMSNWANWAVIDWAGVCAIDNIPAVGKCMELCERLGMDSGNCCEAIGFAMELSQRGILPPQVDGLKLEFGNEATVMALIQKIAHRDGFGDVLAEGSARAGRKLGNDAERYAVHIRGVSPLPTDPRLGTGWSGRMMATSHLTGVRGDNIKGAHLLPHYEKFPYIRPEATVNMTDDQYTEYFVRHTLMPERLRAKIYGSPPKVDPLAYGIGKAHLVKFLEDFVMVPNALGMCMHVRLSPDQYARLYSAFSGENVTEDDMLQIGERSWNLQRAFDVRRGLNKIADWPDRFYEEGIGNGPAKGAMLSKENVRHWLEQYYEVRGWDPKTGIPTREKLQELDMEDVAEEFEK